MAAHATFAGKLNDLEKAAGKLKKEFGQAIQPFISVAVQAATAAIQYRDAIMAVVAALVAAKVATAAFELYSKRAAIVTGAAQALSGPKGWLQLAAGLAAAAGVTYFIKKGFDQISEASTAAVDSTMPMLEEMNEIAVSTEKAHKHVKDFQETWDQLVSTTLDAAQFDVDTLGMTETQKAVEKFRQDLAKSRPLDTHEGDTSYQDSWDAWATRQLEMSLKAVELDKQRQKAAEKMAELQAKVADFGKTDAQRRVAELQALGLRGRALQDALRLQEKYDGMVAGRKADEKAAEKRKEDAKMLAEAGRKAFEDTLTPIEKAEQKFLELKSLFEHGDIDQNTFDRGSAKNLLEFRKQTLDAYKPIEFLEAGSQGAFSAINKSKEDPLSKLDKTAQQQLAQQIEANTQLKTIADLAANSKIVSISK